MKFREFSYDVRAEVEISLEDVELLRELATAHYDATARAAAKEGMTLDQLSTVVDASKAKAGFLYSWRNQVSKPPVGRRVRRPLPGVLVCMTSHQINLCCKILEMVSHFKPTHPHYKAGMALDKAMTALFHKVNDEVRRCNVSDTEPAFTAPTGVKTLLRRLDISIGFREEGGTVSAGPILRDYEALPPQIKAWAQNRE